MIYIKNLKYIKQMLKKLKIVPVDLKKVGRLVDKYFVKKAGYDKSSCCKGKIPVLTGFANNSQHETDQKNLEERLMMLIKNTQYY